MFDFFELFFDILEDIYKINFLFENMKYIFLILYYLPKLIIKKIDIIKI